jgi:hypothetical protein
MYNFPSADDHSSKIALRPYLPVFNLHTIDKFHSIAICSVGNYQTWTSWAQSTQMHQHAFHRARSVGVPA